MIRVYFAALALLVAGPGAAAGASFGDPAAALEPVTLAAAIAEFKTLCADTSGEPTNFAAARTASAWKYSLIRETPYLMRQPGNIWQSASGILFYADTDWLPKSLPSPQCRLNVALLTQDASDPSQVITVFATALGLGKPAIEGKLPQQRATWVVGAKGDTRSQYSVTIELMGGEPADLSLNLSRLRN